MRWKSQHVHLLRYLELKTRITQKSFSSFIYICAYFSFHSLMTFEVLFLLVFCHQCFQHFVWHGNQTVRALEYFCRQIAIITALPMQAEPIFNFFAERHQQLLVVKETKSLQQVATKKNKKKTFTFPRPITVLYLITWVKRALKIQRKCYLKMFTTDTGTGCSPIPAHRIYFTLSMEPSAHRS